MSRSLRYLLAGFILIGLLAGVAWVARLGRPKFPPDTHDSPRALGRVDAPIQIIEYSDFQCPACRVGHFELKRLLQAEGKKLRLVYQHFPLENHRWAPLAHHAAECAAREDQFWGYHDRLYENQHGWSTSAEPPLETLMDFAKAENLDLDRFAQCLGDPSVDRVIREEKLAGGGLGVRSTPSYFVNGKFVVGAKALREEVMKLVAE